jgi:hypothetical protein
MPDPGFGRVHVGNRSGMLTLLLIILLVLLLFGGVGYGYRGRRRL